MTVGHDQTQLVFLDLETTGLYPHLGHELWEIGMIYWNTDKNNWQEIEYRVRPERLDLADPMSLLINHFYDRTRNGNWDPPGVAALYVARILAGKHIVGACPWFDAKFLEKFLRENRQAESFHYHLIDVEALMIGAYALDPRFGTRDLPLPWKSRVLMEKFDLEQPNPEKHTALGDARMVKRTWDRIINE